MRCHGCGIPTPDGLCWCCSNKNRKTDRHGHYRKKTRKTATVSRPAREEAPAADPVWEEALRLHREQIDRAMRENRKRLTYARLIAKVPA